MNVRGSSLGSLNRECRYRDITDVSHAQEPVKVLDENCPERAEARSERYAESSVSVEQGACVSGVLLVLPVRSLTNCEYTPALGRSVRHYMGDILPSNDEHWNLGAIFTRIKYLLGLKILWIVVYNLIFPELRGLHFLQVKPSNGFSLAHKFVQTHSIPIPIATACRFGAQTGI